MYRDNQFMGSLSHHLKNGADWHGRVNKWGEFYSYRKKRNSENSQQQEIDCQRALQLCSQWALDANPDLCSEEQARGEHIPDKKEKWQVSNAGQSSSFLTSDQGVCRSKTYAMRQVYTDPGGPWLAGCIVCMQMRWRIRTKQEGECQTQRRVGEADEWVSS